MAWFRTPGQAHPRTIAVIRALRGLGDMLCLVPALRALRGAFPHARIALIGLPSVRPVVDRFDAYLDELVEFPGFPGIPEQPLDVASWPARLAALQERHFDLALQMHGSGSYINPFAQLLGARRTAGFFLPGELCPDPDTFMPYPLHEPEVWRLVLLLRFLDIPAQGEELEFPLLPQDERDLAAIPEARFLPRGAYVCVHAGAFAEQRRWPARNFAAVADALAQRGLRVVLTGSADEAELATTVQMMMSHGALSLAGRTSLGALAALLRGARLLVSNDTGVSHLAAALHTPSVVIFGGSDPQRWAPLDRNLHRALGAGIPDIDPPSVPPPPVAVGQVLEQADDLLQREPVYVA